MAHRHIGWTAACVAILIPTAVAAQDSEPQFLSEAFEAVTDLLPPTSDGIPLWALVLLAGFLAARELFRWLGSRKKPEAPAKEVKPEHAPSPEGLPLAMQIDTRDKVHEIGHDVKNLLQHQIAADARLASIEREVRAIARRRPSMP